MDIAIEIALKDLSSARLSGADITCEVAGGKRLHLFGEVFYHRVGDKVRGLDASCKAYLKRLFSSQKVGAIIPHLEGQYLAVLTDPRGKTLQVFSDLHSRQDYFYAQQDGMIYIGDSLEFIFRHIQPQYDQRMLAHLFCVYGWYTPKGTTIYSNVRRLKAG